MTKQATDGRQPSLFDDEPAPAPRPPQPKPLVGGAAASVIPEAPPQDDGPPPPRLHLIRHEENGIAIEQRPDDGYINATAMCRAHGKLFAHYRETGATTEFLGELSSNIGIAILDLVRSRRGGDHSGTWVHPLVAVNLGQWISPRFAVAVSRWVFDWLQGRQPDIARDDFAVRRIAEQLELLNERVERIDKRTELIPQISSTATATYLGQMHLSYPDSQVARDASPPPYSGSRKLAPTASGLPKLVEPRRA